MKTLNFNGLWKRFVVLFLAFFSVNALLAQFEVIWAETDTFGMVMTDMDVFDEDIARFVGQNWDGHFFLSTEDGGLNWDTLFFEQGLHSLKSLSFISEDIGFILSLGQIQTDSSDYFGFKILKTENGGDSWIEIFHSPPDFPWIFTSKMSIDFINHDTGVITGQFATITTFNGGINWEIVGGNSFNGRNSVFTNGIYLGLNIGWAIYSLDSLQSFSSKQLFDDASSNGFGDVWSVDDNVFIYSASAGGNGQALGYPEYNFGQVSISELNVPVESVIHFPYYSAIWDIDRTSNYIFACGRTLLGENSRFMKSFDNGETWYYQDVTTPEPIYWPFIEQLECINDSVCYAYSGTNIYKTMNGGGPLLGEVESIHVPVVVGLENVVEDQNMFNIFPNPAQNVLNIETDNSRLTAVFIFDMQGRVVFSESEQQLKNDVLNVSNLDPGVYFIKAFAEKEMFTARFVKD